MDKLNICFYCIIVQVNQEELEKIVDKLKMVQDEKKKEARKVLTVTSTALNSPASQPSSPHRQVVLASRGLTLFPLGEGVNLTPPCSFFYITQKVLV